MDNSFEPMLTSYKNLYWFQKLFLPNNFKASLQALEDSEQEQSSKDQKSAFFDYFKFTKSSYFTWMFPSLNKAFTEHRITAGAKLLFDTRERPADNGTVGDYYNLLSYATTYELLLINDNIPPIDIAKAIVASYQADKNERGEQRYVEQFSLFFKWILKNKDLLNQDPLLLKKLIANVKIRDISHGKIEHHFDSNIKNILLLRKEQLITDKMLDHPCFFKNGFVPLLFELKTMERLDESTLNKINSVPSSDTLAAIKKLNEYSPPLASLSLLSLLDKRLELQDDTVKTLIHFDTWATETSKKTSNIKDDYKKLHECILNIFQIWVGDQNYPLNRTLDAIKSMYEKKIAFTNPSIFLCALKYSQNSGLDEEFVNAIDYLNKQRGNTKELFEALSNCENFHQMVKKLDDLQKREIELSFDDIKSVIKGTFKGAFVKTSNPTESVNNEDEDRLSPRMF